MARIFKAGTAVHLLCLSVIFSVAACSERKPHASTTKRDAEIQALVESTKQNPSMTDPSKAGAPLNFDPYPKSGGKHHEMDHHEDMQNKEAR